MTLKLVVVDDHRLFREGLKALLTTQPDLTLVGEADEAQGAYSLVEHTQPDVVLLDVQLPMASGVSIAREVLRRQPQQRILALSMFADEEHVAQAFEVGVLGDASKDLSANELFTAIRSVGRGQAYPGPGIPRVVPEESIRMRRTARGPETRPRRL